MVRKVSVPALDIQGIKLKVVGDSPFICHNFGKKRKQMLAKQMRKASAGREAKDPVADFLDCLYWLDGMPKYDPKVDPEKFVKGHRFGFKSVGFKKASVRGGKMLGMAMTDLRSSFHVEGEHCEAYGEQFVIITGTPVIHEATVRNQSGVADIRHRAIFHKWSAELPIRFNAGAISAEQLVAVVNAGGFGAGIGDYRPEKSGSYGMFHVESQPS